MTTNVKVQAARFARLFAAAFVTQAAALDLHHLGRSAIIATIVGAAEVAWRQFRPVPVVVATPTP